MSNAVSEPLPPLLYYAKSNDIVIESASANETVYANTDTIEAEQLRIA